MTPILQLRKGKDYRFRMGHPFVYSNEIQNSLQLPAGQIVDLVDHKDAFLGRGFWNASSLIVYRNLAYSQIEFSEKWVQEKLLQAYMFRKSLQRFSYRLFFGQSDGISGLIIDVYSLVSDDRVLVLQLQSAGVEAYQQIILKGLINICHQIGWQKYSIVIRRDSNSRLKEGLPILPVEVLKADFPLEESLVHVNKHLRLWTNLKNGQKTGLFLDQVDNLQMVREWMEQFFNHPIRLLDLCCYVGQWSAYLQKTVANVHATLVDVSSSSLSYAKKNVIADQHAIIQKDVFDYLSEQTSAVFDIIIVDPPAFIKSKKDLAKGMRAYLKLFTESIRVAKPSSLIVFCSCSGLLSREDFEWCVMQAVRRNHREARFFWGQQSVDHPILPGLFETNYLKTIVGIF